MMDKMKNMFAQVRALDEDESGMEAAQVILILLLVVIGIIPVLVIIKNKLTERGDEVASEVDGTGGNDWTYNP